MNCRAPGGPGGACAAHSASVAGVPAARAAPSCLDGRKAVGAGSSTSSRSEEHTSELQSLMRISYAVFCLKKKIKLPQPILTHEAIYYNFISSSINTQSYYNV